MESLLNDDLFNLPMVLDSSDLQSVNCSLQSEVVRDQSVPLVIFENGDFMLQNISDSSLLLSNNITNENILSEDDVLVKSSPENISNANNADGAEDMISFKIESDSDNSLLIEDFVETIVTYKCRLCSFKNSDRASLSAHLKAFHLKNSEKEDNVISSEGSSKEGLSEKLAFMCGKCSEAFASFSDWRSHMALVHEMVIDVNDVVGNEIINGGPPVDLEKKKKPKKIKEVAKPKYVIPKKEKKIACPVESCLIRLSCRDFIQKHQECHVSPRLFSCPHCSQPFRKWFECANHLWRSHSQDVDLYSCPVCDFKHALRAKLDIHMKIHRDEKEYLCNECGKAFKQAFQLQNHRVSHIKVKDPASAPNWSKRQQCSQCKRTFCDSKALKKHIQSVHFNLRPYVCNVCGHTSALKHRMTLHLRQHTGEKPFSCSFCPFVTGDKNTLRRHSWRHARVRPYSCPHCDYSCIQSRSMKKHIQSQHPSASEVISCSLCSFTSLSKEALQSHIIKEHSGNSDDTRVIYISTVNDNNEGAGTSQVFALPVEVIMDEEESQNYYENAIVDTGGITIPAEQLEENG